MTLVKIGVSTNRMSSEVRLLLGRLIGVPRLVATLLYGCGLRLAECLTLRVKAIDVERHEITVRQGKGRKDRRTMLPSSVTPALLAHLEEVRAIHERDLAAGFGRVAMPDALAAKYPNTATSWPWQFVLPASKICRDPTTSARCRNCSATRTGRMSGS